MNRLKYFILLIICVFSLKTITFGEEILQELPNTEEQKITVVLNNETIDFGGAEPVVINGTMLVPIRGIFEKIGANFIWNENDESVKITYGNYVITQKIGNKELVMFNTSSNKRKSIELEEPAQLIKGRVMIPLRQTVGAIRQAKLTWDDKSRTAYIEAKPFTKEPLFISIGNSVIQMEYSRMQIENILGTPSRVATAGNGSVFYTYARDYTNYILIGFVNNKVSYVMSNAKNFYCEGYKVGAKFVSAPEKEDYLIYFESSTERTIDSIIVKKYGVVPAVSVEETERQIFDLTNAMRIKHDLNTLVWNDDLAMVAKGHSRDMTENNFFDHENLNGQKPSDRARNAGIKYARYGENILSASEIANNNAFLAYVLWFNSPSHRKNLLGNYTELGVGIDGKNATQNFMTQY